MPLLATWILSAALMAPQDKATFSDTETGFAFDYPTTWKYSKQRLFHSFVFPLKDGSSAEMRVLSNPFNDRPDAWQRAQADINKSLMRIVERQYEEVILGVPLLMTKAVYKEGDKDVATLIGLLYSSSPNKMTFRMTVPADSFDEAESTWKQTLNSLRTISGNLPIAQDPNKSSSGQIARPEDKREVVLKPSTGPKKPKPGPVRAPLTLAGLPFTLRMAKGWTSSPEGDGFVLTNPRLKGSLKLTAEGGNYEAAQAFLLRISSRAGSMFSEVKLRRDATLGWSRAGVQRTMVERQGLIEGKPTTQRHTVGHSGTIFWSATYSVATPDLKRDEDLLEELFDQMVILPGS